MFHYFFSTLLFTIGLLIGLSGCTNHWQYSPVFHHSYERVWEICQNTLNQYGYTGGIRNKDSGTGESEWQYSLYPLRPGGYRQKVRWQIIPGGDGAIPLANCSCYQIKLKVIRESNLAHHDGMDERHALWLADGCDIGTEALLQEAIEAKLCIAHEDDVPDKK